MAKVQKKSGKNQARAERAPKSRIHASSATEPAETGVPPWSEEDRATFAEAVRMRRQENLRKALKALCGQGLWTDESSEADGNLRYERAIIRVASAQLRAIRVALSVGEGTSSGAGDWEPDGSQFTDVDAGIALGGLVSWLESAPELIQRVRALDAAEAAAIAAGAQ